MIENTFDKMSLKYVFIILIAVFASTIFHELAHWLMGEILGNKMTATLNSTNLISGEYLHEWNRNYITMAGPIFTVLQAIIFYFLLFKYNRIELYPFLFYPFVFRLAAGIANIFGPNDEGRFGQSMGVGLFTISIIICSFLLILIYKISKAHKISLKFNMISFLLCCIFLLLLTYLDAKFKIKII
jgi:hypothetical protein